MLQLCLEQPLVTEMYGCFRQSRGWGHTGQSLASHLLVVGLEGEAVFRFDRREYPIRRGELLIVPAHTFYTAETQNGFAYDFLHIRESALRRVSEEEARKSLKTPAVSAKNFWLPATRYDCLFLDIWIPLGDQFERVLFELTRCRGYAAAITPQKKLLLDLCVSQLLAEISSECSSRLTPEPEYPELLMRMLLWIQRNFVGDASLSAVSAYFGVSKTYAARLFRRHLSTTVTGYVNELRLQHAAELLRLSTMNISQIAVGVGFGNVYDFSRLFHRRFRISPSVYRKQNCV